MHQEGIRPHALRSELLLFLYRINKKNIDAERFSTLFLVHFTYKYDIIALSMQSERRNIE